MQHCQGSRLEARGRGAAGPNLGFAVWPLGIKPFINPFSAALLSTCSGRALLSWEVQTSGAIKAGPCVSWALPAMRTYCPRRLSQPEAVVKVLKNPEEFCSNA